MTLDEVYGAAVREAARQPGLGSSRSRAGRLAWAAARALGGAAAHITVAASPTLRMPWGVSDPDADVAEQWDFTTGAGPCAAVHAGRQPVWATYTMIEQSWPAMLDPLIRRTGLRSAVALPLNLAHSQTVLTVYYDTPDACLSVAPISAVHVASMVAAGLEPDLDVIIAGDRETWPFPAGRHRLSVPIAVGFTSAALAVPGHDAFALLRGYAFSHDRTLDDLAHALVTRTLSPHELGRT